MTYLVRRSDSGEREYRLYELTWLWRTAALPHDAVFKDANGVWRPVSELVEPILEKQRLSPESVSNNQPSPPNVPARHAHRGWWIVAVGSGALIVAFFIWLNLHPSSVAGKEQRPAPEQERGLRAEDVVSSLDVIPGMTPEQVRRTIGPPKRVQATGDASVERWFYRKQVVVFENGKVIGVEALK